MKFKICLLFFLAISFQLLIISLPTTFAAGPKNSITVLPQLTQLDLTKDKPESEIYYTNNSSQPVELGLSLQDVRELEDRNPVGILDPKEAENYKYSLSSWAYLSTQTLLINPGETQSVKVSINSEKLSPGGHYGTVLAEINQSTDSKKAVQIKGVLASLLFVRASTGSQIEEAKIAYFGTESKFEFPKEFSFRFQNTGNVELIPYGLVELKDGNGLTIAKGIVNEDSLFTLPEAIRKYDVPMTALQNVILPGKYNAVLSLHFGKTNKKLTATTTILTGGNSNFLNLGIGVIAGLILLLFLFKLIHSKLIHDS
jgi:hypothetical protein